MLVFENISKRYRRSRGGWKTLIDGLDLHLHPGDRVGILGRNGAGKTTFLGMVSGSVKPSGGRIIRRASISWPLGFTGNFHTSLTGAQNVRFVARIYGIDTDALVAYVAEFSELGDFMAVPVRKYSAGMRARLAFGMSMGIGFDYYLVDEITAVGDDQFREKSLSVFRTRLAHSGLLMVSHSTDTIEEYCTSGLVLEAGTATYFENVRDALAQHARNMARDPDAHDTAGSG